MFIEAFNSVLGNSALTKEYHDIQLNGLSTKKKLELLGVSIDESRRIYDIKQELTTNNIGNYINPDKKVEEICKTLISLGYSLYCVSNSIRSTIIRCLEGMGVLHFFSGIISNECVRQPKPSPEPYLTLYKIYNINPSECLILEDSPHGIESATKSGGKVLAVKDCSEVTLDNIIKKISSLIQ